LPRPAALEAIEASGQEPSFFLDRHIQGDWGWVDDFDKRANDQALIDGDRLLSVYLTLKSVRIVDHHRSCGRRWQPCGDYATLTRRILIASEGVEPVCQSKFKSFHLCFQVGNCDLICYTESQQDGTWEVRFDAYVTTQYEYPHDGYCEELKTLSPALQELVLRFLGVETTLEPDSNFPALIGRFPSQPDPNELLAKMGAMLANVDADSLWFDREV
jgi:hypothetical protein